MSKTKSQILANYKRYLFVLATIFLVTISSCPLKGGLKALAGMPVSTESSIPSKGNQKSIVNTIEKCAEIEITDTLMAQNISIDVNSLLPFLLCTAAFFCLFAFRSTGKAYAHPLYNGSKKIRNSIPLFLEYRKLIIHYVY